MAEHSLRLKATLDTKEVQAELQKLRDLQQQVSQNSLLGNSNTQNANLTNLNSTIGKLNGTLTQIQKNLQQLSNTSNKNRNPGSGNNNDGDKDNPMFFNNKMMRTMLIGFGVNEIGNSLKSYYEAIGTPESKSKSEAIGTVQNIASTTMMGFMAGGAPGAAIGAGVGLLTSVIESLGNEAKSTAEFLKDLSTQIKDARTFDKSVSRTLSDLRFSDKVDTIKKVWNPDSKLSVEERARQKITTVEEAQKRADKYGRGVDQLKIEKNGIDFTYGDMIEKLKKMNPNYSNQSFEDIVKKKGENQQEIRSLQQRIDPFSIAGWINDPLALDGYDNKEEIEKQIKKLQEENTNLDEILAIGKANYDTLADAVQRRGKIEAAINELEAKQAAEIQRAVQLQEQLNKEKKAATTELTDLSRTEEGRKNKADIARIGYERIDNATVKQKYNDYLESALSAQADYKSALTDASNASNSEEYKNAMERANESKKQWAFSEQQSQMFGNELVQRLQEKLRDLKAPNMTQVNSLASQGFMINKNDDEIRWKQQTDYASQQTQLQKEIRDRLQSMDTSSTFN